MDHNYAPPLGGIGTLTPKVGPGLACFPRAESLLDSQSRDIGFHGGERCGRGDHTSEKDVFAGQHVKSGHRLRIPALPTHLPPPLCLFPSHIVQRLLKHTLPRDSAIGNRIGLSERLNRQANPLGIIELGPSGPRRTIVLMYGTRLKMSAMRS